MSPSCVATIFEGDNGGATSRGVSATEIRVGIPGLAASPTSPLNRTIDALFEHLNRSFEFYGRRLVPVYVDGRPVDAPSSRALGTEVAANNVFAATLAMAECCWAMNGSLAHELGRQEVVTMLRGSTFWWTDRTLYDPLHPYLWSVYPSSEDIQRNLASFACSALVGGVAKNAGDPGLRNQPRRFAVISSGYQVPPAVGVLTDALAACTNVAPLVFEWKSQGAVAGALQAGLAGLVARGATTAICVCESSSTLSMLSSATSAGFKPEWLLVPTNQQSGQDENWMQQRRANGTMWPLLRLSAGARILPVQARPWYGPIQTVDPKLLGESANTGSLMPAAEHFYEGLLVLASGVQGAGPNLTPETFAAGLMTARFPNPGAGQAPYWQPSVGFGPGDHSFFDDYQVAWWSDDAEALDIGLSPNARGSWCYLQQGARFQPGGYPADADRLLFNPAEPCR